MDVESSDAEYQLRRCESVIPASLCFGVSCEASWLIIDFSPEAGSASHVYPSFGVDECGDRWHPEGVGVDVPCDNCRGRSPLRPVVDDSLHGCICSDACQGIIGTDDEAVYVVDEEGGCR